MLLTIGLWVRGEVEESQKDDLRGDLTSILNADVEALDIWMKAQRSNVTTAAEAILIGKLSRSLLELGSNPETTPMELVHSPIHAELRQALAPWIKTHGYDGFLIADKSQKIVGSLHEVLVGKTIESYAGFVGRALEGRSTVSHPIPSVVLVPDASGQLRAGVPTMFTAAPVRDAAGDVVGVLALRIRPEIDFTRIMQVARKGKSGETYAFDKNGLMLSESRFDDDLRRIRLIPNRDESRSILNIVLRDPQVDLLTGARTPRDRNGELPLTRAVAAAVTGSSGVDVDGYRDYRGVMSLGAWRWLPEYDFGVVTEVDRAESYRALHVVRATFWGLFGLLFASAVAIFVFSLVSSRWRHSARQASLLAKQLGQYTLDEMIGAGGMGVVYRAHHTMLRRPTAVKLLNHEKTTDTALKRFEREVQITSQLNHPNTISIYDFGRTPEGVFYYAMEYLDGIDLEELVERYGPQPERRIVHILKQICGSLSEAHDLGLIHRDIKPANVILNKRGGLCDFVKVLDFGLVKAVDADKEAALTAANCITGTPHYMSPESIDRPDLVDSRSDLYAVGAVGYFLLTATPVFQGRSVIELLKLQATALPQPPSQRLRKSVSPDLELLLLKCLGKSAEDRPASARELSDLLDRCEVAEVWSMADAEIWWNEFERSGIAGISISPTGTSANAATDIIAQPEVHAEKS